MSLLGWLVPTSVGPLDRATYRLRLVLAVQFMAMGIAIYLILWLGKGEHPALVLPELAAHVALGFFLWIALIRWYTMLLVAAGGVAGIALGGPATVEVLTIFFVLPLTLPFYRSTRVALATQIIIWNMVAWTGAGMAFTAPDRLHWSTFIIEASAIGVVGTLMVIFRLSLLRLTGVNQRLDNLLSQYQMLYENGGRTTLALDESGFIRSVHGASVEVLGAEPDQLLGRPFASIAMTANPPPLRWEDYLYGEGKQGSYDTWMRANGGSPTPIHIHLASGNSHQRRSGMALVVDIQRTDDLGSTLARDGPA
jgi:PAS domain-containing protein